MDQIKSVLLNKSWQKGDYSISTDPSRLDHEEVNKAFASDEMHWASALPAGALKETLENSLCFGMYEIKTVKPETDDIFTQIPFAEATVKFVGFARCITDYTTLLYLTDVWILPEKQGQGLGKWLVSCIKEVMDSMPRLRRIMLLTSDWERSVPFYEKFLDATLMESSRPQEGSTEPNLAVLTRMGRGFAH